MAKPGGLEDWHQRFCEQATWSRSLRNFIFRQIQARPALRVLDVGSGTGALHEECLARGFETTALDIDLASCRFSAQNKQRIPHLCADGRQLPFCADAFELSFCHLLLLWLEDPGRVLTEMARVTRPGGHIIAFYEPDYSARIDSPGLFEEIGVLQNRSLAQQGVNLSIGRQLGPLMRKLGLEVLSFGMLGYEQQSYSEDNFEKEWDILAYDLSFVCSPAEIRVYHQRAREELKKGQVLSIIPAFYACAKVK